MDVDFTNDYNCWHSLCNPIVNYSPTTPTFAPLTASYDIDYCTTAGDACTSMGNSRTLCSLDYRPNDPITSFSACYCAPRVLMLEFTCSFLQNVSCLQVPARTDHMSGWSYCDNVEEVWGTAVPASLVSCDFVLCLFVVG